MSEKKPDFVVSDRRRFAPEGELREESRSTEDEKVEIVTPEQDELPSPPSAAEQRQQHEAYKVSGKKLDDIVAKAGADSDIPAEMNFERIVESFYMTALIQMGAIRQEGEAPRVDILGARQTIDSITILQEKTKGNLTDREQTLLQNVLFELRMAWIEITNAIANAPPPSAKTPHATKK